MRVEARKRDCAPLLKRPGQLSGGNCPGQLFRGQSNRPGTIIWSNYPEQLSMEQLSRENYPER